MRTEIKSVVATVQWDEAHRQRLRRIFAPAEVAFARHGSGELRAVLERCEVAILSGVANDRILAAPKLRWIHCDQSGLDEFAPDRLVNCPVAVTSSAGRSGPVLAEHALYFMLCLCYDSRRMLRAQKLRLWGVRGQSGLRGLHGRKICIVGLGATGTELARRCLALEMEVCAYRRRDLPAAVPGIRVYARDRGEQLGEALADADFVALCASLNDQSYRMLGEKELKRMKSGSYLVNVARAQLVDTQAMVGALRSGQLAGAGTDVADPDEPLPPWSRFWAIPNLLITPHVTPQLGDRTGRTLDLIEANRNRLLAGEPLLQRLTADDVFSRPRPKRSRLMRRFLNTWIRLRTN